MYQHKPNEHPPKTVTIDIPNQLMPEDISSFKPNQSQSRHKDHHESNHKRGIYNFRQGCHAL
jgi:hypothetical protein